ncbi:hypothetical protein FNU76_13255 [Chitinimonas arctica]|uniref:Uncharacterized protein n=1 Tax=Chitinimonas arctica TaxID=2594795 RepID=A0A516SGG0_9NEIS|nr:secretin N-terminal domain-containing protein [Chitinimonas arctica]QDQ27251.1 hypothetical protein FNU76_13255 [Chitinimonas arctica]
MSAKPIRPRSSAPTLAALKPLPLLLTASLLAGCASQPWLSGASPKPATQDRSVNEIEQTKAADAPANRFFETPAIPPFKTGAQAATPAPAKIVDEPGKEASVVFNNIALPQFIDSVFGVILKKTIAIDPQVQTRQDLVSMRTGKSQTPSQLYEAAKTVLRSYGITVQELPGLTRFVPENNDSGSLPEIRRGRALPEVPESLRPLFYLVELEHTNTVGAVNWLRTAFGSKITAQEDNARNAIMLSGAPQNVSAALQALSVLDQPLMRGRLGARIVPTYWSAEELSKRLSDILTTEGYFNGTQPTSPAPLVMIPVGPINSIIVFANNQALLDHTMKWAEELDQPTQARNSNYFIYPVRNADATDIAATLSQVLGGGSVQAAPAAAGATGNATGRGPSRVVVDKATNSIIVQASSAEYQQWISLLKELDRPAKNALVSVSVAEVRLTEKEDFGFEWLLQNLKIGGLTGTLGKTNILAGTLKEGATTVLKLSSGLTPRVLLNALASTNKTRVLANPSLLTRSGEDATINVGQEVPVTTSQQSTNTTGGLLETVQYRSVGVILKVRPVVHAGGRIDLDIDQEVSSAASNNTGTNKNPVISSRKLTTKLTVTDGNTIVLGGLMRDDRSDNNAGLPYVKDIPVVGPLLFGSTNINNDRTELVILITAYAIEDDFDVQAVSDAFRKNFPWTKPLLNDAVAMPPKAGNEKATGQALLPADTPPPNAVRGYQSRPYQPKSEAQVAAEAKSEPISASPGETAKPSENPYKGEKPLVSPPAKTAPAAADKNPKGRVVSDEALNKELFEALQRSRKP